jgi:hypothetical protein
VCLASEGERLNVLDLITDDSALDARLSFIRRQSGLDTRASLFVLTPVGEDELEEFVTRYVRWNAIQSLNHQSLRLVTKQPKGSPARIFPRILRTALQAKQEETVPLTFQPEPTTLPSQYPSGDETARSARLGGPI